jgi:hypothetical protein
VEEKTIIEDIVAFDILGWWLGRSDLLYTTSGTWDWRGRIINFATQANNHGNVKSISNSFRFYNNWAAGWSHSTIVTNVQAYRKTLNANVQDCDNWSVLSQNPIKHQILL